MHCAEIITIGTELLLGEIQDTNTRYLARKLRELGISLFRSTIVGDNVARISEAIQEALNRADILLITGGLGPTVDDPTREAVAKAFGVNIVFRDELWQQIQIRFEKYHRIPTENNKRQAFIPETATAIRNDVGTAPAFYLKKDDNLVIAFPGVPKELEYIFEHEAIPLIHLYFPSEEVIIVKVLHSTGIGESMVDNLIGELEKSANPTVGLLAHPGQVDIRITARAKSNLDAEKMIASMEKTVRSSLEPYIFGIDQQTIEDVIIDEITRSDIEVLLNFKNFPDEIRPRISFFSEQINQNNSGTPRKYASFVFTYIPGIDQQGLQLFCDLNGVHQTDTKYYGGPPSLGPIWGINTAFDFIRNIMKK